jgi:nucleotide-binding universal stress UspA family protein
MSDAARRILVGVDGSAQSGLALRWAADLARQTGGEVIAAHALGLLAHIKSAETSPAESHRKEVGDLLEGEWSAPLRDSKVQYRCLLLDGNPVSALMAAAADEEADLIVVGTRGTGGFPGLQLGSTSLQLVQHCGRPVVVVPGR